MWGHKESKEEKIKRGKAISKGKTGKKRSEEFKQKLSKTKQKQWKDPNSIYNSKEYREKLRKIKIGIYPFPEIYNGRKNPNWQGGISFEPYGLEFNNQLKEFIRQRDNFQCHECKYPQKQLGYKLHIHHIDYNKKNNHSNNLISLCRNCHAQTNFNRRDWTRYYQNKVGEF